MCCARGKVWTFLDVYEHVFANKNSKSFLKDFESIKVEESKVEPYNKVLPKIWEQLKIIINEMDGLRDADDEEKDGVVGLVREYKSSKIADVVKSVKMVLIRFSLYKIDYLFE